MKKLFGTDGVRGKAGEFLDANTAMKLAQAVGIYFLETSYNNRGKILVGKDTRRSGYMIENAIVSGLTSVGYNVIQIGPMPTPAIAYLTESMRCDLGIMISASHNPFEDNGIKFFNCRGKKLNHEIEAKIEKIFYNDELLKSSQVINKKIGKAKRIDDVIGRYIVSIKNSFPIGLNLSNMKIVLDCANGAAYKVAPTIFDELDANLIILNDKPDGFNINDNCGALHPENLGNHVKEHNADIGIALDGDSDRLVVVDENGNTVHGDKLIGSLAVYLKSENQLLNNGCVVTTMSNSSLEKYLNKNDIKLFRSDIGDKNVMNIMEKENLIFGGEQSGHIIFSKFAKTGDGIVSALQVSAMMVKSGKKASELFNPFELSPQILRNFTVENKKPIDQIDGLNEHVKNFTLDNIRHLIRYSGTENKIRLLLEGDNEVLLKDSMDKLCVFLKQKLC